MGRHRITVIDRITKKKFEEKVYGSSVLQFFYGDGPTSRSLGRIFASLFANIHGFSRIYGWWQKLPFTKKKIIPFLQKYEIDSQEFLDPVDSYQSFNDFFIRKLRPSSRPITKGDDLAIIPADGRYLFFQDVSKAEGFYLKGETFDLAELLQNDELAKNYQKGSMVIARLCPVDYHRFHFPLDCIPGSSKTINGLLFSVNPIALMKNIHIFSQNKRVLTSLQSKWGNILFLEIGATSVGSIVQTYQPNQKYKKGAEKGYFEFGGSSLVILFPPNTIVFDQDLLETTGSEIRCLMGQSMGKLSLV